MSANETFTHKAFCRPKTNAVHSMSNCVRGIPTVQCIQQKTVIGTILKTVEDFEWKRGFFWKPSTFFLRFTVFSISLHPHRIPPNGWARCSPQSLRGCCLCRPTCARWSRHVPVSPYADRQPFSRLALSERGTPTCMLRVFLFSSWHWCVFERLHALYAVQARMAWRALWHVLPLAVFALEYIPFPLPEIQRRFVRLNFSRAYAKSFSYETIYFFHVSSFLFHHSILF